MATNFAFLATIFSGVKPISLLFNIRTLYVHVNVCALVISYKLELKWLQIIFP